MQNSGSLSQSVLHRNRSHESQPIGGVRLRPLSRPGMQHWQTLTTKFKEKRSLFHFHSWIPVTIALWSSNKNIIVCRIWTAEYSIWQHRIEWRYHRRDKMCACTFLLQITTVVLFDLDIYSLGQIKQRETSFYSFLCSLSFPSHFWLTHDPVSRFDVRCCHWVYNWCGLSRRWSTVSFTRLLNDQIKNILLYVIFAQVTEY